ncbi:hypothetical protein DID77_02340 [Candidatus Marinamargulisbacteria bacterium SCGC AG-439-L15]|nr:hypothetical protein DID77_02340 [Candidatus Marinamargulisbacteria bacterium SCGC AG-439-L15]
MDLKKASQTEYDCVIVGGGINGLGLAVDLSSRGYKVALFEKGDFGSGTSSRSSKLIHGGLRYLETGQIRLVREACRERHWLLEKAPHLVKPLAFIFPVYKEGKWSRLMLRLGLFFYDFLAGLKGVIPHKMLDKSTVLDSVPSLNSEGLLGGAIYYDAQMDDSRICVELAMMAKNLGADLFNYVEIVSITKGSTKVVSVDVKDVFTGELATIGARFFAFTVGPWINQVSSSLLGIPDKSFVSLSKGVHLVVSKIVQEKALILTAKQDGRVFFVIPWGASQTLIGTTDTIYSGDPNSVSVEPEDRSYLLKEVNAYFPDLNLSEDDILFQFAGLRPLSVSSKSDVGKISREHYIPRLYDNAYAMVGGKYTTYRVMAEDFSRLVCRYLDPKSSFVSFSKEIPFYGMMPTDTLFDSYLGSTLEVDEARLKRRYGTQYKVVLKVLSENSRYRELFHGTSWYKGELVYGVRYEFVKTVMDFLRRRTTLLFSKEVSEQCVREVLKVLSSECLWSDRRLEMEDTFLKSHHLL